MANRHMKKMLNIANHQGNANQNHVSYHITPIRIAVIKETPNKSVGKDVEKNEPSCTVGGNVNRYTRKYYGCPSKN